MGSSFEIFCPSAEIQYGRVSNIAVSIYAEDVLPQPTAFRWLKQIKEDRVAVTKQGGPVKTVSIIVREDHQIILDVLVD